MNKKLFVWVLAFVFILSIFSSSSLALIESYDATINIFKGEDAVFDIDIKYSDKGIHENFLLPESARGIEVHIDGEKQVVKDYSISIPENTDKLSISYVDIAAVSSKTFVTVLKVPEFTKNMNVKLVLPENARLEQAVSDSDVSSSSVFPQTNSITSDGKLIFINWHFENLEKDYERAMYVNYQFDEQVSFWLVLGAFIIVMGFVYYMLKKKPEEIIKLEEKDKYEQHLKDEELEIVNILKKKGGSCEQGTLRVITSMSKAKLSHVLSELESRKIIYKEKKGRKNIVFLK